MQYSVKELRARKGVTQAQAAHDLGVSVQTYNAWENNISNVGISKVTALAAYYGVSITEIFLPDYLKNIQVVEEG